jgi:hypothetical protein
MADTVRLTARDGSEDIHVAPAMKFLSMLV